MEKSEILERADKIQQRYHSAFGSLLMIRENIKSNELLLEQMRKQHADGLHELEINGKAVEVLKKLIGILSEKGIQKLKELLTYGLNTIFEDRRYAIDVEIAERGNVKTAEFWLLEAISEGKVRRTRLRDSVGGGVQAIVSLILRVYFIIVLDLRRFVALDESLTQINEMYIEGMFRFMKQTVNELGFNYMFVTQDSRFIGHGDRVYRVEKGIPTEEKRRRSAS